MKVISRESTTDAVARLHQAAAEITALRTHFVQTGRQAMQLRDASESIQRALLSLRMLTAKEGRIDIEDLESNL